jgi:hypothetical protein
MQVRRAAFVVAAASFTMFAYAGPESSSKSAHSEQGAPAVLPSILQNLAGQWDGSMQVRLNNANQAATGSFACRANSSGLLACFDGKADGKPVEGASFFFLNSKTSKVESVAFNTVTNSTFRGIQKDSTDAHILVFSGHLSTASGAKQSAEQVIKLQNNALTVSFYSIAADGSRSRIMQLDMSRAAQGEQVSAASLLNSSSLFARVVPQDLQQTRTAGVSEPQN